MLSPWLAEPIRCGCPATGVQRLDPPALFLQCQTQIFKSKEISDQVYANSRFCSLGNFSSFEQPTVFASPSPIPRKETFDSKGSTKFRLFKTLFIFKPKNLILPSQPRILIAHSETLCNTSESFHSLKFNNRLCPAPLSPVIVRPVLLVLLRHSV